MEQNVFVELGDTVRYRDLAKADEIVTVQIVNGPNDPEQGIIGCNSPVGAALLHGEIGDEVEVRLPLGIKKVRITEILKFNQSNSE